MKNISDTSTINFQRAKQLLDHATEVSEYRKTLPVILAMEIRLDADQTADLLGTGHWTAFLS